MPFCRTGFQINLFLLLEAYCSRLAGDCCLKLWKKSRLFYTHNIFRKKLNCIKNRKKYMKYCENHVFVWKLSHFYVFFVLLTWVVEEGPHSRTTRTIENGRLFSNSKQNIYVWNLKLRDYREEHKSYLQGVFQLVRAKIFMLIIFSRGPKTTYCSKTK